MSPVLSCAQLDAGYTGGPVVRDFHLQLHRGEIVALLGPNGAGKTTVLMTLAGLLPAISGRIEVHGRERRSAAREGLVLVPDDRALFTTLTVRENIKVAQRSASTIDAVLDYFPPLRRRLDVAAGLLSGGEQQMLAIGRALVQEPQILLIDELSMGLAPVIVSELLETVRNIASETGAAIILVEQHVRLALAASDRAVVLVHGRVALAGDSAGLLDDMSALECAYLG